MQPRSYLEALIHAGWPAVLRWVEEKASETNLLEFKLSTSLEATLSSKDRDTVAKVVSGFANTDGGLLVFGIEARRADNKHDPDVVQRIDPVRGLTRFADMLGTAARDCVEPKVAGIAVEKIEQPDARDTGVAIVHVPRSFGGPHRAASGGEGVRNHYFMRTASSTTIIPHRMLAALFSARPEPRLVLEATWSQPRRVTLSLRNEGPGTARNIRIIARVTDWMDEEIGHLVGSSAKLWLSRAGGVLTMRARARLFSEEPCPVGVVDLDRSNALHQVNGIKLHARVDSETTRPLLIRGELLRIGELRSFALESDS
jgi:hypothetical protein